MLVFQLALGDTEGGKQPFFSFPLNAWRRRSCGRLMGMQYDDLLKVFLALIIAFFLKKGDWFRVAWEINEGSCSCFLEIWCTWITL